MKQRVLLILLLIAGCTHYKPLSFGNLAMKREVARIAGLQRIRIGASLQSVIAEVGAPDNAWISADHPPFPTERQHVLFYNPPTSTRDPLVELNAPLGVALYFSWNDNILLAADSTVREVDSDVITRSKHAIRKGDSD